MPFESGVGDICDQDFKEQNHHSTQKQRCRGVAEVKPGVASRGFLSVTPDLIRGPGICFVLLGDRSRVIASDGLGDCRSLPASDGLWFVMGLIASRLAPTTFIQG